MGPYSRFKTNSCLGKSKVPHISFLSRPLQRQVSSVILLLSVICAPIHGLAQTKERDKRGVGVPSGPVQTSTNTRPILSDRPELILQTGHTQSVRIFIKGGVVGGEDNTVRIWNVQTGRELQVLHGHALPVGADAFSYDGRFLTSVSGDSVKRLVN